MSDLELELHAVMVKIMVRYPDGASRIEAALQSIKEAGEELELERWHEKVKVIH